MADPITLGLGGLSLVGGLMSASGNMQASQQQANQLQAQQNTAEYNARINEYQAEAIARETVAASNMQMRQARKVISNQSAAQAENNYFGQTADMMLDQSAANAAMDRLNIIYQGRSKVAGLKQQADYSRYQGKIAGDQIQPTLNAGYMNAGSSLLSSIGQSSFLIGKNPVDTFLNWGKM